MHKCVNVCNFPVGVQMSRISRDLPVVGADGAEFASFAVLSWSSLNHF